MGHIMEITDNTGLATKPKPISAKLATKPINLIQFAKLAGKNMLEVIPIETTQQTYLRGPTNIHWICDPEIITEILVGKGKWFPKSQFTKDIIGSAVGNGLILSEGEKWKAQRKRYSPLFAARNLPMLAEHFALTGQEMADAVVSGTDEIDVAQMSKEATLTNISRVMFAGSDEVDPAVVRKGLDNYFEYISYISLFDLMGMPSWVPRLKWMKGTAPVKDMRALAQNVIEKRRAEMRDEPKDFLDLMIAALAEDTEDIDTTVDNLLTFVVAGHETAANTLAWGLYLLALYQDVQTIIREEISAACGSGPITYESLKAMPRLRSHVYETMRLYPAAAFFARDASEDLTVKDVHFAKGDAIFVPVYTLHRNSLLWDEPETYKAERFFEVKEKPERGQFIPFGDGQRVCIGAQYAETEIMVLMAALIRHVEFGMSEKNVPRPILTFTMRPEGPLVLTAKAIKT